jgi:putative heme iron utilization protein
MYFGRAASCNVDQARIKNTGFRLEEALDLDRVPPAIAKVIEISQRLCADIFEDVVEAGPPKSRPPMNH